MFRTLRAVVGFYEATIAGESRNPNVRYEELDQRLRELQNVDEEDVDLIEFLIALSDGSFESDDSRARTERPARRRKHSIEASTRRRGMLLAFGHPNFEAWRLEDSHETDLSVCTRRNGGCGGCDERAGAGAGL